VRVIFGRGIWSGSFFPFLRVHTGVEMYIREYRSCICTGIGTHGMSRGMRKFEWHISKFGFSKWHFPDL
jgi:hypothetical protein